MKNQLLLIDDVENVGRSGDVISVKPGYARNFLIPQKKAVVADKGALRMQARLKEERAKRAVSDKKEAEELAQRITGMTLEITVKVDQEGRMYGSVAAGDIVDLFGAQGIQIEKRNVALAHPIKALGEHAINLKLKEGVPASFTLQVLSDIPLPAKKAVAAPVEETPDAE